MSVSEAFRDFKARTRRRPADTARYNDDDMREYRYMVDRDGRIFHDGTEIIDAPTLRFFLRAMQRSPDGRYLVLCQGERNWFEVPDTPFVVQRVGCAADNGRLASVELLFAGGYRETLDASTLEARGGYLDCRVRGGAFPARFGRGAVQQLATFLREDEFGLSLDVDGVTHRIAEGVDSAA